MNIDDIRKAIKRNSPSRAPLCEILWHNQDTLDYYGDDFRRLLTQYPNDVTALHIGIHYLESNKGDDENYRWAYKGWQKKANSAIDNCPIITDWDSDLERFIADMPSPHREDAFDEIAEASKNNPQRYILANWGHYFHQRLCYIRGTENLLYDFYDNSKSLFRLMDSLLEFYEVWAKRTAQAGAHGVWAGDDLGMQTSLFMAPDKFREIYKPYYKALADILHKNNLDFWLHTCGNVYDIMKDLVDCGVDVVHPIQAGCMDAKKTVENFSNDITFWVGIDVQQLIPFGTVTQIRKQVVDYAKIFYNPRGGVIYGAGNAILAGAPIENVEAYAKAISEFCLNLES